MRRSSPSSSKAARTSSGHSYGGVISLLAAALRPDAVRSLTVIEPPALDVARGDPAVDAMVARIEDLWSGEPPDSRFFLGEFLRSVGSSVPMPEELPPPLQRGAELLLVERLSHEARVPLAALRGAGFPILVVSGAHSPVFDAVCDVLERELAAERAVLPGAGHAPQRAPGFNEVLEEFLARAEA